MRPWLKLLRYGQLTQFHWHRSLALNQLRYRSQHQQKSSTEQRSVLPEFRTRHLSTYKLSHQARQIGTL